MLILINVDIDQLNQILDICGTPPPETLSRLGSDKAQMYIRSLDLKYPVSFKNIFITASSAGIFYLIKLLICLKDFYNSIHLIE